MTIHRLDSGIALYTPQQIREIELSYAQKTQAGTYPLMEAAGKSAYQQLRNFWPNAKRALILTGKGNNAGDGFVIARLAVQDREKVTLCEFASKAELKGDALIAYKKLSFKNIEQKPWNEINLETFDIIVDAIFGTGFRGVLKPPFTEVIHQINKRKNKHHCPVVSIDVPSGLNSNTGDSINEAIKADMTTTFIGHKKGLFTGKAANHIGQLKLFTLGLSKEDYQPHPSKITSENWHSLKHKLIPREATSHKGNFGHCHIVGGAKGMTGAAILVATAAAKCGSGLTSASVEKHTEALLANQPEIMVKDIAIADFQTRFKEVSKVNCLIVGPGMNIGSSINNSEWSQMLLKLLAEQKSLKNMAKVYDAGALNWLAKHPNQDNNRVLTPHPGEAARLLNISTNEVNQDRFAASQAIAEKYAGVCVLKGTGTIISDSNGQQIVCAVGNPGMASGGMGDILSGIIGALLAQGFSLMNAAALGVSIHGEAADCAAGRFKYYRGLLASDLFPHLPKLLNP